MSPPGQHPRPTDRSSAPADRSSAPADLLGHAADDWHALARVLCLYVVVYLVRTLYLVVVLGMLSRMSDPVIAYLIGRLP